MFTKKQAVIMIVAIIAILVATVILAFIILNTGHDKDGVCVTAYADGVTYTSCHRFPD